MKTMKTFFIYFLLIAGFFLLSNFLENGTISSMYYTIKGSRINNDIMSVEVAEAKATNVNGYLNIKVTNNSNQYIDKAYVKVVLKDEFGSEAMTEYSTIENLEPGKSKNIRIKFRGNRIKNYTVEFVSELPDKSNIINLFGWEFDATNLFGLGIDLTNVNGKNLTEYFSWEGIKSFARKTWRFSINVVQSVPLWAYITAGLIVLWYI